MYVAAFEKSLASTLRVFFAGSRVKIVESIAVIPSSAVISHVSDPQIVRLPTLVASSSVQLKTAAKSYTLYVKAGEGKLDATIVRESVKQGFTTMMSKSAYQEIAVKSLYSTLTRIL